MRAVRWIGVLALVPLLARGTFAEAGRLSLAAPESVDDLRLADVDGDGVHDVLLVHGRRLQVHRGQKGRLPDAQPTWERDVPASVSFVDVLPREKDAPPSLLAYGSEGAQRLPIPRAGTTTAIEGGEALSWHDAKKLTFARLVRAGGRVFPRSDGWTYRPASGGSPIQIELTRKHIVEAPGPFLEDVCAVKFLLPELMVGRSPARDAAPGEKALWSIDGQTLIAQAAGGSVRYDLSFLDAEGNFDQFLVDLDGDGRPELVHRIFENRESHYGFFRTRAAAALGDVGATHKPATSSLFLAGFQADPSFVDLDGDGLKDLVITSIQIDAKNTLRALGTGSVTAETRAFLNRWKKGEGSYFADKADAVVKSDIGVKIRFDYAGTIQIDRSFTILLDGDYDGDGRRDLAIRTSDDELTIRRGTATGVWEPKGRTVPIAPKGAHPNVDGHAADLDGDGRDEIVLRYERAVGGRDAVWVLDPDR